MRPARRQALAVAFGSFGQGRAAMQPRIRTEAGRRQALDPGSGAAGPGLCRREGLHHDRGQFNFVILLFSAVDGRALASFDAAAITRLRTAAMLGDRCQLSGAAGTRKSVALFGAGRAGPRACESSWPRPMR